jgi:hypothetical protein
MADTMQTQNSNPKEPVAFDERTRRALELRRQIRAGVYRPDPEAVARAILAEWSALSTAREQAAPIPTVETAAELHAAAARFVVAPTGFAASTDAALSA